MRLSSTAGRAPAVTFRDGIRQGLAPDGGLYLPDDLPVIPLDSWRAWQALAFQDLACRLAARWLAGEFPPDTIERLTADAFDFPVPIVPIGDAWSVVELFHGPTLAFKDFGARFLARFFGQVLHDDGGRATILVATSGDTGSAVARGFAGVPGVRVVVLYPAGKVSPFQESQMATIGGNVTAVRVPGVFDDCQRLVKAAFLDPALSGLGLSSANSISIGRLLPQSFYYAWAWLSLAGPDLRPVVCSVPSGNLGNLTAGVLAARTGVAIRTFLAATNANDVLPEYLDTGAYRSRPSVPTMSNAMDVGDPSNFVRLLALHGGQWAGVRAAVAGEVVSEEETRDEIRRAHVEAGYVLDPHGAVASRAARRWRDRAGHEDPLAVLATAHPAKFGETIAAELGFEPELPERERGWRDRPLLAVPLPDTSPSTFRAFLLDTHA
jgi:threonine synthase